MRDDLLDAQASIDWAVSNFQSLDDRLNAWRYENTDLIIEELEPQTDRKVILAGQKSPFPRAFNVEVGAYINSIRSGLDILATVLADRCCMAKPEDAYFPVATSQAKFDAGNYKGAKFVKALPDADRKIIESLKPYQGGNNLLWSLHYLDIVRKHRRLLPARLHPASFNILSGEDMRRYITMPATWDVRVYDKTVLALISKSAPESEIQIVLEVTIDEPAPIGRKPVVAALYDFANLASAIIRRFDT